MEEFTGKILIEYSILKQLEIIERKLFAAAIGGTIAVAGVIGVSLHYSNQKKYNSKEQIVKRYIHRVKTAFHMNKWDHEHAELEQSILTTDINNYIYRNCKDDKIKEMTDKEKELGPGRLCQELFREMLCEILKEIDANIAEEGIDKNTTRFSLDQRNTANTPAGEGLHNPKPSSKGIECKRSKFNEVVFCNQLFSGMLDEMLDLLKTVEKHKDIYTFLKHSLSSIFSETTPSIAKSESDKSASSPFESILTRVNRISIENEEKLYEICQSLSQDDSSFLEFSQICVAKCIYSLSTLDPHFPPQQTCFYLSNNNSTHFQSNTNQTSTNNTAESIEKERPKERKSSMHKPHRLVSSPLCRLLTELHVSEASSTSMIDSGYVLRVYENACELSHRQNSELVSAEKSIETLFLIISKILSTESLAIRLLQSYGGIVCNLLMKALSFEEAAETTSMDNSTIVSLVNWVAEHFDVVLARMRVSKLLRQPLIKLMHSREDTFQLIARNYLNELEWIHELRRDDRLRESSELEVELSMSTLILPLILKSLDSLPDETNINSAFDKLFLSNEHYDREIIVDTLTASLCEFLFTKELFTTMLEKTASSTNSLILAFTNFRELFELPDAKKYDEIILGLEFAILLGGAANLCESIVEQWKKDALDYDDLKIYMSSDIAFLLQILEDDCCLLNAYCPWEKEWKLNEQELDILKQHAICQTQKLIINYLEVYSYLKKDSLREELKNELSNNALEWKGVFEIGVESVAEQSLKQSIRSLNSSLNHSINTMNHESMSSNYKLELQKQHSNKFFASLFNKNAPLLMKLLASAENRQVASPDAIREDYELESKLYENDQPLVYLQQVRRLILKDIALHTAFHGIFILNENILLEKLRIVSRILQYIYDVIEDGVLQARASKKLEDDQIKSLLILYVFDQQLPAKIQYVSSLTDEDGELVALHFLPTLENIISRREGIQDLLRDIFKGENIAEIIV